MKRTIHLPVFDQLIVRNYPLYPGKNGKGLELNFEDGVTVLAGINGIGKTTLLNLLMRMVIGPADPKKLDRNLGRVSKRELKLPRKRDYFASRVPGKLGGNATATLTFRIGTKDLTVTRFLHDMGLKSVDVGRTKLEISDEIEFIGQIAKWAGVSSAYDFHIIVRYLQFFSEDRLPILWSAGTQFEFFKILFFEEKLQSELNNTFAEIQRVDSDHRNRTHQLNKREGELPPPPETDEISIDALRRLAAEAQDGFKRADSEHDEVLSAFEACRQRVFDADEAFSRAEANLTEVETEFIEADAHYIANCLPNLDDKLRFLMQGLGSLQGCFVCGARDKERRNEISEQLHQGHCFVCRSKLSADQHSLAPITSSDVRTKENALEEAHLEVNQAGERREVAESDLRELGAKLQEVSSKRRVALQYYEDLQRSIPSNVPGDIEDLRSQLAQERKALTELAAERNELVEVYRSAVTKGQHAMRSITESLRANFSSYAKAFLMEDVTVDVSRNSPFKPATGTKTVNIPTFTTKMTSSTFKQPEVRLSSDSVSESQKEFLDLAFRMAMIDLISPDEPMTLVIETPEASLDSWFMRRAADLMRRFTKSENISPRRLIATSNLNGTKMIPALLGILGDDNEVISFPPEDAGHLVNLMEETARATVLGEGEATSMLEAEVGRYFV